MKYRAFLAENITSLTIALWHLGSIGELSQTKAVKKTQVHSLSKMSRYACLKAVIL